jgi:hypothetical protein
MDNEPDVCPKCLFDFRKVRNTSEDVIGIFSLQRGFLMGWKCPHCSHEWEVVRNG